MAKMAGSRGSWGFLAGLAGLVVVPPIACNDSGTGFPDAVSATMTDLLADVGPEVVLPALADFQTAVSGLSASLTAWEAALESGDGADALATAQVQWRSTMAAWQALEVMQIGPAGSSLTTIGGMDLRDELYSWPTINPCRIDQETAYEVWDDPDYFTANLVNSYGLDALEHTLFSGLDNTCPGQVDINAEGTWEIIGESGVKANRAAFSVVLSVQLAAQAEALTAAWSPDGEDFSGQLDGTIDGPYTSEQEALNAVYDALFYLEIVTKDRKLGTPLGISDCGEALCPEAVEGLESGSGVASIVANLDGFEALFTGGAGTGLDDLLSDLGHGDLSDEILADLDTARALALTIDTPLDAAVSDQTAEIEALYEAVKVVTDNLKGDLATVLALTIPSEAAGDND
ncbi:MAG: putative lipoprotein [Myxococcota bacterium]|jgi:predicted lipoprotein